MKLRRHNLIAALTIVATLAGIAVLDANIEINLERPTVATR